MVQFDVFTPFSHVMLPTTQSNALSVAQNMKPVLSARLLLNSLKTHFRKKNRLNNGLKQLSRKGRNKQMEILKNFIHTACPLMLQAVSIDPSGKASLSVTSILQSRLMFYINYTREYSSIWLLGAKTFLLLRNWTIASEHFHLPLVSVSSNKGYLLCPKYLVQKAKHGEGPTWLPCWLHSFKGNSCSHRSP